MNYLKTQPKVELVLSKVSLKTIDHLVMAEGKCFQSDIAAV